MSQVQLVNCSLFFLWLPQGKSEIWSNYQPQCKLSLIVEYYNNLVDTHLIYILVWYVIPQFQFHTCFLRVRIWAKVDLSHIWRRVHMMSLLHISSICPLINMCNSFAEILVLTTQEDFFRVFSGFDVDILVQKPTFTAMGKLDVTVGHFYFSTWLRFARRLFMCHTCWRKYIKMPYANVSKFYTGFSGSILREPLFQVSIANEIG